MTHEEARVLRPEHKWALACWILNTNQPIKIMEGIPFGEDVRTYETTKKQKVTTKNHFLTPADSVLKGLTELNHLNPEEKVASAILINQAANMFRLCDETMRENTRLNEQLNRKDEQIDAMQQLATDQSEMAQTLVNAINEMAMRASLIADGDEASSEAQRNTNRQMARLLIDLTVHRKTTIRLLQAQVKGDKQVVENTIMKLSQHLQLLHPMQQPAQADNQTQREPTAQEGNMDTEN
jgi:hypothetical protein